MYAKEIEKMIFSVFDLLDVKFLLLFIISVECNHLIAFTDIPSTGNHLSNSNKRVASNSTQSKRNENENEKSKLNLEYKISIKKTYLQYLTFFSVSRIWKLKSN